MIVDIEKSKSVLFYLQISEDEMAEMPSCNLAESVHNKWLQQSGKKGNDFFVATVDDMVRAFMQVVAYYQFLKGEQTGSGPDKNELRLRAPCRLHNALETLRRFMMHLATCLALINSAAVSLIFKAKRFCVLEKDC